MPPPLGPKGQAAIAAIRLHFALREIDDRVPADVAWPCCPHCAAAPVTTSTGACPMGDRHTVPCTDCGQK
jgi:hypothetical protein